MKKKFIDILTVCSITAIGVSFIVLIASIVYSDDIIDEPLETETTTIKDTTETTAEHTSKIEPYSYMKLAPEKLRDFSALVTLEADIESQECKEAVASVILNRMTTRNMSLDEVMYEDGQFEPASMIKDTEPSAECMEAVYKVTTYGPTIPEYVTFFRADHYHNWDSDRYISYKQIDNTYFSYDKEVYDRIMN